MGKFAHDILTLQAKLAAPRLSGTVARNRLNKLLDRIVHARIVAITAGAGYGKTTFAAQACHHMQRQTIWYRLDPSDKDVIVFIHYLIAGIQRHHQRFGQKTLARIQSAKQFKADHRVIWNVFLHELESIVRKPMIIVLDDFHHIHNDAGIQEAMGFLLAHLPETVQFLVVSRKSPAIDLSRLVAGRKAFEIAEKELAFTPQETETLFQKIFDIELGREIVEALAAKTGGWAAGLILFQYNLKEKTAESLARQLSLLNGSQKAFGCYLKENIIQSLPIETKEFLFKTAILSQLEVGFCNQLLGIENAAQVLQQLENQHLFTFSLDEQNDSYQYHHLFRDYLRANLNFVLDDKSVTQLHMRAAQIWQQLDAPHEAVAHYLAAGALKEAGNLLVRYGDDMIMGGRINQVLDYLYKFPAKTRDNDPWLTYFMGNALFYKGKTARALAAIETARSQFSAMGDRIGEGQCLSRLATGYYVRNDFVKAEAIYKEILPRVADNPEYYSFCLGGLILVCSRLGKFNESDQYFRDAETCIATYPTLTTMDWVYIAQGYRLLASEDLMDALHYGKKAGRMARRAKHHPAHAASFPTHAASLRLMACCWIELDEDEKGLATALEGIDVCERYGTLGPSYAWCHLCRFGQRQNGEHPGRHGVLSRRVADLPRNRERLVGSMGNP